MHNLSNYSLDILSHIPFPPVVVIQVVDRIVQIVAQETLAINVEREHLFDLVVSTSAELNLDVSLLLKLLLIYRIPLFLFRSGSIPVGYVLLRLCRLRRRNGH